MREDVLFGRDENAKMEIHLGSMAIDSLVYNPPRQDRWACLGYLASWSLAPTQRHPFFVSDTSMATPQEETEAIRGGGQMLEERCSLSKNNLE